MRTWIFLKCGILVTSISVWINTCKNIQPPMYIQHIYNRWRVPNVSLSCIDSSSLWTDRPSALWFFLPEALRRDTCIHWKLALFSTHSDLALLSVITHNPALKPQVPLPFSGIHCVLEDYVLLQKDSQTCRPGRNIVTLLTRSVASLSECLDAPVNRQHHSQSLAPF